jgi:CHAT domain-containing protein
MKKRATYILLFFLILCASCKQGTKNNEQYHQMLTHVDRDISVMLDTIKQHYSVTELVKSGFHELGFKLMADSLKSDGSDAQKLCYGKLCIDYGDYENGLEMIASIKSPKLLFDKAYYRLTAALNSMDTLVSKPLLDSLQQCLRLNYTKEHEAAYLCMKGYHYHNCRNLTLAIEIYKSVLDTLDKYKIYNVELLRTYRRIANSYNDLYGASITAHRPSSSLFNKALFYYTQEKKNTKLILGDNAFRLISNELTTALLDRNHASDLVNDVINRLYVVEDSEYLITINPIYYSAALELFASLPDCDIDVNYLTKLNRKEFQKLKLVNQQVIGAMSALKGNDIPIYGLQQSSLRNLIYHSYQCNPERNQNDTQLLHWSSLSKNNSIDFIRIARSLYGTDAELAARSWVLLHELKLLGQIKNDNWLLSKSQKALTKLRGSFFPLIECLNKKALSKEQIRQLVSYCTENDAVFIDYSIERTILQVIKVDSSGLHSWHKTIDDETYIKLFESAPGMLGKLMEADNIMEYEKLGAELSDKLMLTNLCQHNIIISTEQRLEQVPFSALPVKINSAKRWQDIEYIGNTKTIRYVPNVYTLLKPKQLTHNKSIDILYSTADNARLPSNAELINYLSSNFSAKSNQQNINQYGILHIVSHTSPDQHTVKFYLDRDTISIATDGLSPDLTVLQGCKSSSGKLVVSGYLSLNRTFLYNGTKATISSFWDADNTSSAYYFKEYYKHYMKGESVSESIYKAQQSVKNNSMYAEWAKPLYWANWHLIGQDLTFSQP